MNSIFLLIFFLIFFCISGFAQTVILHPVGDNTIFSENGANSNGAGTEFFAGRTGSHAGLSRRRALLQFDLTSIPPGSIITGLTLSLTCTKAPPAGSRSPNTLELHKCLAAWGEGSSVATGGSGAQASIGDATWTCRFANGTGACTQAWSTNGGDFAAVVSSNVTVNDIGIYTFPGTTAFIADVQSWVDTPASNFGWLLSGDEVTAFSTRAFSSRESGSQAPTLKVTYSGAPCNNTTWTGAISTAWETPGNWSCGTVPGATTNVVINNGAVLLNSSTTIKSLILNTGASFIINPGFKLSVIQ